MKKTLKKIISAFLIGASFCVAAFAQNSLQNQQVIKIVVPFAAGSQFDQSTRALVDVVKKELGNIVVENKTGAGGNAGSEQVAKAKPDGNTLLIATVFTHAINPAVSNKMPFDAQKDFVPIIQIARSPNVLLVNPQISKQFNINTVKDLIKYAKDHPGRLNYGSSGNGSMEHLAGELFKRAAAVNVEHIAHRGAFASHNALISGEVDFSISNLQEVSNNINTKKVVPIAVTSREISGVLPNIASTLSSVKNFDSSTWWGIVAPKGTPDEVINRLNNAFNRALNNYEVKQKFNSLMTEPAGGSAKEFGELIGKEQRKYKNVAKDSGVSLD